MTVRGLKKWIAAIAVLVAAVTAGTGVAGADGSSWYGEPPITVTK